MDILVRSWQDLGTILAKILSRYCHGIHFAMIRSYQEIHVPKKNFIVESYLARKDLKGSQQKSTSIQIYIVRHDRKFSVFYNLRILFIVIRYDLGIMYYLSKILLVRS